MGENTAIFVTIIIVDLGDSQNTHYHSVATKHTGMQNLPTLGGSMACSQKIFVHSLNLRDA